MKVAAVQARPVWLNATATTDAALSWMQRAADQDVRLVVFPETFLPGYPVWLSRTGGARFEDPRQKRAYAAYLDAAVELDGPELARIVEAARDLDLFVVLGVAERGQRSGRGTTYCTVVCMDPTAGIVGAHRKLVPTHDERMVWGFGDGAGLSTHDHHGWRVGGLACWENWMPLARYALYADGVEVQVSLWPGTVELTAELPRFAAREGRCFHVAASGLLAGGDVPTGFEFHGELAEFGTIFNGGSAIASPAGDWLHRPAVDEEGLITSALDRSVLDGERQSFDVAGHYARPDVFTLQVDRRRRRLADFTD